MNKTCQGCIPTTFLYAQYALFIIYMYLIQNPVQGIITAVSTSTIHNSVIYVLSIYLAFMMIILYHVVQR